MIGPDAAYYARVAAFNAAPGYRQEAARLLDALALAPGSRVLDLGCGLGALLPLLRARGLIACGVDAHDAFGLAALPDLPLVRADARRLPFRDGQFAAVLMMHSLAHFEEVAVALAEAARVLAPRGRLGIITPNRSWLEARAGRSSSAGYQPDPTVERHVDADDLKRALAAAGFSRIRVTSFGRRARPWPWPGRTAAARERLLSAATRETTPAPPVRALTFRTLGRLTL